MVDKNIFLVTGPSASGKSTLITRFLKNHPTYRFSISYTTREMRKGEIDGIHYNFITVEKFKKMILKGKFLEYKFFCGNFYGTPCKEFEMNQQNIIVDVEMKGYISFIKKFKNRVKSIFIFCEYEEMKHRLFSRLGNNRNRDEIILKRTEAYKANMELINEVSFHKTINTGELSQDSAYEIFEKFINFFN